VPPAPTKGSAAAPVGVLEEVAGGGLDLLVTPIARLVLHDCAHAGHATEVAEVGARRASLCCRTRATCLLRVWGAIGGILVRWAAVMPARGGHPQYDH
jgi:hypothetical protein